MDGFCGGSEIVGSPEPLITNRHPEISILFHTFLIFRDVRTLGDYEGSGVTTKDLRWLERTINPSLKTQIGSKAKCSCQKTLFLFKRSEYSNGNSKKVHKANEILDLPFNQTQITSKTTQIANQIFTNRFISFYVLNLQHFYWKKSIIWCTTEPLNYVSNIALNYKVFHFQFDTTEIKYWNASKMFLYFSFITFNLNLLS